MARSGAVPKIFLLIRSCNRSVPCMEVVSYAVQVLLHVAKVAARLSELGLTQEARPARPRKAHARSHSRTCRARAAGLGLWTWVVEEPALGEHSLLSLALSLPS